MQIVVAVFIGVVIGASLQGGFGAVAGGLLAWLLLRSNSQQRQIDALQRALTERTVAPATATGPATEPASEWAHTATLPPDAVPGAEPLIAARAAGISAVPASATIAAPPAPPTLDEAVPPAAASGALPLLHADTALIPAPPDSFFDTQPDEAAAAPPASRPPAPRPAAPAAWQQWLFGGNTIVKAGIAILFLGLAFLAKYATEHVQIAIEWRLAGIGAAALGLLATGWVLRGRRPGYAQVLQGGAVAVLYLTLFAAFRFYGVLDAGVSFGAMVLVAALAAALAVLQDAPALAVVGALGGFATPILLSTGGGSHVALFGYYLVLDLGIAAVAWVRTWRPLNLVGFAGTFIVATAWGVLKYQPADYATSQAFLVAFFALFLAILLMPARQPRELARGERWAMGSLLFGLPTVVFVLQAGLVRDEPHGVALSALALAAVYVLLALMTRHRVAMATVFEASLGIATVFLTLVIPFALDARSTAGAWALEGAGLVWIGFRQQRGLARAFGYALQFAAGAAMANGRLSGGAPAGWIDAELINGLLMAVAALATAWLVHRHAAPGVSRRAAASPDGSAADLAEAEPVLQPLLIGWALLWLLGVTGERIDRTVEPQHALTAWVAAGSVIAAALVALGQRLRWPMVTLPAIGHAGGMALATLALAAAGTEPLAQGGALAWPLAFATHAFVIARGTASWPAWARHGVHALGVLVLAGLGALQGRALTAGWGEPASAWPWLGWLAVPALLLLALPRAGLAARWPVRDEPEAYGRTAAGVIAAGLWLWAMLANAFSDGTAQPLPHVPLVNPLDLGIGLALVGGLAWLRSPAAAPLRQASPTFAPAALGVAGFLWLNGMLVRGFHHLAGVPYRVEAWTHSLAVQSGLTLLWGSTALVLMWFAARRARRAPWLVGAVLLGAVVVKLLLVDLSGTGTVTRIVSFIGVGLLMLVIGYVAPLPASAQPRTERADAAA